MDEGGSKKNPEYTPQMWLEFAVAHGEGEFDSFLKYWLNDKEISELAEEGMQFTFTSYPGSATQTANPAMTTFLAGSDAPNIPFKWTAYTYVNAFWDGGYFSTIPNFAVEAKTLLCETDEKDANPIRCLYDLMTDEQYGANIPISQFNGDPDTVDSSWKIASDYCDEIVTYVDEDDVTIEEPRFRYSNVIDSKRKGYDIVKDILQSCRGIIAWSQGKIYCKIENENETVSGYYSDEYLIGFVSTGASTVDRVYVDVAIAESSGFWEGAYLNFKVGDITYSEMVEIQGSNYFDMVESLSVAPTNGTDVYVTKDNIKEGTFKWAKTGELDRHSSVRVEFINREFKDTANGDEVTNQYQWDVVEWEQPEAYYKDVLYDHPTGFYSQVQIRIEGIKRKSQAYRMAKWFADFNQYVVYICEFVTDHVGYMHKVGDIIGVSHQSLGWQGKEFRIIGMEEVENDEVRLNCVEYNRAIYGDDILQVFISSTSTIPSVYEQPDDLERFHIVQDLTNNVIYINFKRPDNNNWWVGAQVWVKKGVNGDYEKYGQLGIVTNSVKLDTGGIDATQTTVPFDDSTLYGTFPDAGEFWIGDELISYTSINDTLKQFEGCTRGTNATSHLDTEYCHLKTANTPYISGSSDIGTTWYIKAVSITIVGTPSEFASAIEESVLLT